MHDHGDGFDPSMPLCRCCTQAVPGSVPRAGRHLRLGAEQEDHQHEWWGSAPASVRSKTRSFDVPVMEGELDEALAGKPNPASFLQMLAFACKPEGFVVVKLDIDTPAIEQTIIAVLAQRPDLAALIDELSTTSISMASTSAGGITCKATSTPQCTGF